MIYDYNFDQPSNMETINIAYLLIAQTSRVRWWWERGQNACFGVLMKGFHLYSCLCTMCLVSSLISALLFHPLMHGRFTDSYFKVL